MKAVSRARFYGVPVPALAEKLCRETLTYASDAKRDLVDAHLLPNFAYFGAIDKTLAGFFILDSAGDDYTLLDLREPNGQVYFLDHDELELTPRFDSLAAYAKWRTTADRARARIDRDQGTAEDEKAATLPRAIKPRAKRAPATSTLWARTRWLVWLLAQPKQIDDEEAISSAIASMTRRCGGDFDKWTTAFKAERKSLARDPHLALYWLLHFTCTGDDPQRAEVVAAVAGVKNELVRAFVATFGAPEGDVAVRALPAFPKRRSRMIYELAAEFPKTRFERTLRAFEIDPVDRGLDKAVAVWADAKTEPERARVRALVANRSVKGPGSEYLRAELAWLDGKPVNAAWLLEHDPYRPRFLALALAHGPNKELAKRLERATKVDELLTGLLATTEKVRAKSATIADIDRGVRPALKALSKAPPELRAMAARTILARTEEHSNGAIGWAFEAIRAEKDAPDRARLLAGALMSMSTYDPIKAICRRAAKRDEEAVAILRAVIAFDERQCDEYHALYAKEMALDGLGARLAEAVCFEEWVTLLGRPGQERLTDKLFAKPLRANDKASLLGPRTLAPAQLLALSVALIGQPPPKNPTYDKAADALRVIFSKSIHAHILATLKRSKNRAHASRYAGMLARWADEMPNAKTLAAEARAVVGRGG